MTFDLRSAWVVLPWLAIALVALAWTRHRAGTALPRGRHWSLLLIRGCVLTAFVVIGLDPVRVAITPGSIQRPEVHVLLDSSQSMLLGTPETRWQHGTALLRAALERQQGHADVHVHRFGQRLVSVDLNAFVAGGVLARPEDADTQLNAGLQQLSRRLGRSPPAGVVVISDGQVRHPEKLDEMASFWRRLQVPVHVVPLGGAAEGGDAAIIAAVAPAKTRNHATIEVDVFLRSFGFAGQHTELQVQALDETETVRRTLTTLPVILQDGVQSLTVAFRSDPGVKRMRLHLQPLARDLSPANNDFPLEIEIDRTKIRVLLLEGALDPGLLQQAGAVPFRDALLADPDIQCTALAVSPGGDERQQIVSGETVRLPGGGLGSAAELLAYDAIVLSNVPRSALSDEVLGWVDEWIGKRGGGLLMAGGPWSFGGGWTGTAIERMLPVEFLGSADWNPAPTILEPSNADLHPVWRLFEDDRATRTALRAIPDSSGRNTWLRVKPQSGVLLGVEKAQTAIGSLPLLAVGVYGRGRTAALATSLSASLSPRFTRQWGDQDNQYFARFARNMIYWLTESSAIGRRRLVANTDKRFYRPGETVLVSANTYDESAGRTERYRVVALLEPKQLKGAELPPSPVKWPAGRARTQGESGALADWGEEIELHLDPRSKKYSLALPLVEAFASGSASQAFKLELTAYEGQTQIDSSSLDVQVLSDPYEQQNPLPNPEFLAALAHGTGGRVIEEPKALADILMELPSAEGQPTVRYTPLWSRGWVLGGLLALLAGEWFLRRWLGLA